MSNFIIDEIKNFLKLKNKSLRYANILLIGISYKSGIADMRNSINFKILKKLIQYNKNVEAYDPYVKDEMKSKYKFIKDISLKNKYDCIIFLAKHRKFKEVYEKLNTKKNKSKLLDPFEYYKIS